MKEGVNLIEKVVTEKKIDRHQGLNAVLDFLIDIFDIKHCLLHPHTSMNIFPEWQNRFQYLW